MSTSPSWFDQEKFSRLVKKVGPKPGAEGTSSLPHATPPSAAPATEGENEVTQESLASTARISLVSRPPSLLNEHRALPALPRRTATLPGLKSIFKYPPTTETEPVAPAPEIKPEVKTAPLPPVQAKQTNHEPVAPVPEKKPEPKPGPKFEFKPEPKFESKPEVKAEPKFEFKPLPKPEIKPAPKIEPEPEAEPELDPDSDATSMGVGDEDDLDAIWMKMALLNEELAQTIRERDQSFHDNSLLREQLENAEDLIEGHSNVGDQSEAMQALTEERDQARMEYVELRKQFEALKREQQSPAPREESLKFRKELEQQLEGFRSKLEERNKEIASLKAAPPARNVATVPIPTAATGDVAALRDQLAKAKEEVSIAQRGLALSQKALQETRMTLREATEGTSLSRHNFDNLKAECAALTQQNTVLQAQNDQLSRELAATKSKLTTRL